VVLVHDAAEGLRDRPARHVGVEHAGVVHHEEADARGIEARVVGASPPAANHAHHLPHELLRPSVWKRSMGSTSVSGTTVASDAPMSPRRAARPLQRPRGVERVERPDRDRQRIAPRLGPGRARVLLQHVKSLSLTTVSIASSGGGGWNAQRSRRYGVPRYAFTASTSVR